MIAKRFAGATDPGLAALYQGGDRDAGGELLRRHSGLIAKAAHAYRRPADFEDLHQESREGFARGCLKFDPSFGSKVVSYAMLWARAYCGAYIANLGNLIHVPRVVRAADSLATARSAASSRPAGLDAILPLAAPDPLALDALIAEEDRRAELEALAAGIRALPGRELAIIAMRWLDEEKRTLDDIGEQLGISRERVRQLEERAFSRLRGEETASAPGRSGTPKLSAANVIDIRDRRRAGETLLKLATAFGVSQSTISETCSGRRWKQAAS